MTDRISGHFDPNATSAPARFFLWHGIAVYLGEIEDAGLHAHHAVQVTIGLTGTFELETPTENYISHATVIAPDHPHRLRGLGARQAVILCEPESAVTQSIVARHCRERGASPFDISVIRQSVLRLQTLAATASCTEVGEIRRDIVHRLSGGESGSVCVDSRIRKAMAFLNTLSEHKAPVKEVAVEVGLSEGRLMHLFTSQVGIPIRRYLLWLRLLQAIDHVRDGVSLTAAAHEAGFADSAHLSRTFKRMFGLTLSRLFKNSQFVQVISCPE